MLHNFWNIFDKWLSSEGINKDETPNIKFVQKTLQSRNHFGAVLTEEIRIAKFCTEVFVMPKHLMTKLDIPESFLYMSPLRAIVYLNNIAELLWYGNILFFLHLYLTWGVVQCEWVIFVSNDSIRSFVNEHYGEYIHLHIKTVIMKLKTIRV